jgi:hypothetical protein
MRRLLGASLALICALPLVGCGGGSSHPAPASNPTPAISSLAPSSATAGGAGFTLTVNGSGFISASTVQWNGSARTTTFVSATQLTAAITTADIASAGSPSVTVVNPAPGGGTSAAATFTIVTPNPTPAITSLSPNNATVGGAAFTLTVNGSGFISASSVQWNGSARTTTFVSATQISAAITAADIASPGSPSVTVVNPAPGGGTSAPVSFTINPAAVPVGVTNIISVSSAGANGNQGGQSPTISTTGRFVTFMSVSTNLVSQSVSQFQVYLRDTCIGASGCTPSTRLISIDSAGTASGNAAATTLGAAVSSDGNYAVFQSDASNLLAPIPSTDTNDAEIYERTTCLAEVTCTPSTRFSTYDTTNSPPEYGGYEVAIDATGRYTLNAGVSATIVICELCNDPGRSFDSDVVALWVYDTCQTSSGPVANCTPGNEIVSYEPSPFAISMYSIDTEHGIGISSGGRFVTYGSPATDLVANNTYGVPQIYLSDTCNALNNPVAGCTPKNVLVSVDNSGNAGNQGSYGPSLSDDGRFVVFTSPSKLTSNATEGNSNVFMHDTCLAYTSAPVAGCTPSTTLVTINAAGTADAGGVSYYSQSLSSDGRYVAFENSSDAITAAGNQGGGIYVRDTCNSSSGPVAGCTPITVLVSVDANGGFIAAGAYHALSADGHWISFNAGSGTALVPQGQVVIGGTGY